ncbi:MAG TPA: hypothetical protein VH333_20105 [Pseudonocardiaceae bacterium]|nr:hypothetical protein [Pseudonocardiaceae bacterium]
MPVSARARQRCRAFLPPAARIDCLFPAIRMPSSWARMELGAALVVATDTEILVLGCSAASHDQPLAVSGRCPRSTRLGPVTDPVPTITLGRLVLRIEQEYVPVVRAADSETELPPDPLPDL